MTENEQERTSQPPSTFLRHEAKDTHRIEVFVFAESCIHQALLNTKVLVEAIVVADRPTICVKLMRLDTDLSSNFADAWISAKEFFRKTNLFGCETRLSALGQFLYAFNFAKSIRGRGFWQPASGSSSGWE